MRYDEVTGPVALDLFAKSSAVDTDFAGKLVNVAPDGTAINLTEGILRPWYRNLNTGKSAADSAEFVKATNTVLHDAEHPSAIVLPVVSR